MKLTSVIVAMTLIVAVAVGVESASLTDLQSNTRLTILPRAYESNKIRAAIDEAFSLSCITESDQAAANSLRWFSPANEAIELLTSTSLDNSVRRVYTVLKKNQLSVTFDKLVPQDAGIYTCRAVQDGQAVEIKVELVLEKKISFFETPLVQYIRGGKDELVVCKATSIPGPEISWYRKGIYIELKNDNKYQVTNDGLVIKNAQPEDEGVYFCKATVTSTGEVKRAEIDVQVMSEPRWIIEPQDTDGVKDQDVVIRCEAFAKPPPKYKWKYNGVDLVGPRYQITANSLRIVGLTRYDTGTYTCFAENNSGWKEANFRLNVLVGPVLPLIEDVHVVEGNKAVVRCVVQEAFPKATIRWRYTDSQEFIEPLKDPNFVINDDSQPEQQSQMSVKINPLEGNTHGSWSELVIERATRAHRRNFTCVASNKAAVTERQVQLLVDYKPTLLLNLESREIYYSWLFQDGFANSGSESSLPTRSYPVVLTCLADGEPRPTMTWFHKSMPVHHDNIKYRLIRDEPGLSKLEVTPKSMDDFGDYMCSAENRHGLEQRNLQLRLASPPKFAPYFFLKSVHPDMVKFDIKPSDAPDADGGMPIESYRIGWRFLTSDWTDEMEKEVQIDQNSVSILTERNYNMDDVEITGLLPDTEYLFRVSAVNKPGRGVWSAKELKVKTSPRRQPDPVRVTSREDCQASSRCFVEWVVDSSGGSPVREFLVRWRRISYKDSTYQHVNTDKIEPWSQTVIVKAPLSSYEIINLLPDSFYEVEVLARNDIGPSASQPYRIRTLPGQLGEAEEYRRKDLFRINRIIVVAATILGALVLYVIFDITLLLKSDRGITALVFRSCCSSSSAKNKSTSIEYKNKTSQTKIAQHQPKTNGSKTPYQPIKQQTEETTTNINNNNNNNNVTLPMND